MPGLIKLIIMNSDAKCQKDHIMGWSNITTGVYSSGNFYCDKCRCYIPCRLYRWCCTICNYDLCRACSPYRPPASISKSCTKGHELTWSTIKYDNNFFICASCQVGYYTNMGRWTCIQCYQDRLANIKYDICAYCSESLVCPRNHKLNTSYLPFNSKYINGLYRCDLCNKTEYSSTGRWMCGYCEFDICIDCTKKRTIFHSHEAIAPIVVPNSDSGEQKNDSLLCKICYEYNIEYLLRPCGHTLCRYCVSNLSKCPFDRKDISEKLQIFLS